MLEENIITFAAMSDFHMGANGPGFGYLRKDAFVNIISAASERADAIVYCGDFTDHGTKSEAREMAYLMRDNKKPIYAVLGNRDYAMNDAKTISAILTDEGGIHMLPGKLYEVGNGNNTSTVGIFGVEGGADGRFVRPEGMNIQMDGNNLNDSIRLFAETVNYLSHPHNLLVMHYAPVIDTIRGEDDQAYPILGSPLLGELIDTHRDKISLVVHGHSHFGSPKGFTKGGVEVRNVALTVLTKEATEVYSKLERDDCYKLISI